MPVRIDFAASARDTKRRFNRFYKAADSAVCPTCKPRWATVKGHTLEFLYRSGKLCPDCAQKLWDLRDVIIRDCPSVR